MARYKLMPYLVKIKNNPIRSDVNLNSLPSSKGAISFSDILVGFFNKYKINPHISSNAKKTLVIENFSKLNDDLFQGIIRAGEHGYTADFLDITTKKRQEMLER